jgi:hypothetical protein
MPAVGVGNRLGNFISLTKPDDYISIPYNEAFSFGINDNFSISTIVNLQNQAPGGVINGSSYAARFVPLSTRTWNTNTTKGYEIVLIKTGTIYSYNFIMWNASNTNFAQVSANVPQEIIEKRNVGLHVVKIGNNASNWKLYLSGIPVPFTVISNLLGSVDGAKSPSAMNINNVPTVATPSLISDMYQGRLTVWNRALSDSEIALVWGNDGIVLSPALKSGMIMNYKLLEKSGNFMRDSVNAFNGILNNMTTTLGATNQWVDNTQQPILT